MLGFLDIFGAWDPSLAVVMAAALAVAGARLHAGRPAVPRPWLGQTIFLAGQIGDRPAAGGGRPALFGVGWGLVGLCPGPALESLATLSPGVIVFVVAMAAGMAVHDVWQKSRPMMRRDSPLASATRRCQILQ